MAVAATERLTNVRRFILMQGPRESTSGCGPYAGTPEWGRATCALHFARGSGRIVVTRRSPRRNALPVPAMLRLASPDDANFLNRREWLRAGAIGLGGLTLPQLLAQRASAT